MLLHPLILMLNSYILSNDLDAIMKLMHADKLIISNSETLSNDSNTHSLLIRKCTLSEEHICPTSTSLKFNSDTQSRDLLQPSNSSTWRFGGNNCMLHYFLPSDSHFILKSFKSFKFFALIYFRFLACILRFVCSNR